MNTADDHLRLIKSTILGTFPMISGKELLQYSASNNDTKKDRFAKQIKTFCALKEKRRPKPPQSLKG